MVPKGTVVSSAKIQFTSYRANSNPAEVTITAEASGNSAVATTGDYLTNRAKTSATANWSIPAWVRYSPRRRLRSLPCTYERLLIIIL